MEKMALAIGFGVILANEIIGLRKFPIFVSAAVCLLIGLIYSAKLWRVERRWSAAAALLQTLTTALFAVSLIEPDWSVPQGILGTYSAFWGLFVLVLGAAPFMALWAVDAPRQKDSC